MQNFIKAPLFVLFLSAFLMYSEKAHSCFEMFIRTVGIPENQEETVIDSAAFIGIVKVINVERRKGLRPNFVLLPIHAYVKQASFGMKSFEATALIAEMHSMCDRSALQMDEGEYTEIIIYKRGDSFINSLGMKEDNVHEHPEISFIADERVLRPIKMKELRNNVFKENGLNEMRKVCVDKGGTLSEPENEELIAPFPYKFRCLIEGESVPF